MFLWLIQVLSLHAKLYRHFKCLQWVVVEALSGLGCCVRLSSSPFSCSLNTPVVGLLERCGSIIAGYPRFTGGFTLPSWLYYPLTFFPVPVLPSGAKIGCKWGCLINLSCITDSRAWFIGQHYCERRVFFDSWVYATSAPNVAYVSYIIICLFERSREYTWFSCFLWIYEPCMRYIKQQYWYMTATGHLAVSYGTLCNGT